MLISAEKAHFSNWQTVSVDIRVILFSPPLQPVVDAMPSGTACSPSHVFKH